MEDQGGRDVDRGPGPGDEARRSFRDLLDNDQYRTLAENLPDGIVRLDPTGRIEYVNRSIEQAYGGDRLRFIGRHVDEVDEIPRSFAEPYLAAVAEVVRTGRGVDLDLPSLDGRRQLLVRLAPELDPEGNVAHVLSLARDVTELRRVGGQVRLLAENVPDLIFRVDLLPEPRFTYLSPAVTELTGYAADDLLDDPAALRALMHPDDLPDLDDSARDGAMAPNRVERWVRRDGRVIQVEHRDRFIVADDDQVVAVEGVARDVTEQVAFMEALAHEAHHDPLTDLANRRAVEQRLDLELLAAARGGVVTELVVVVADLVRFGEVNELFGHEVGDRLLQVVADRLRTLGPPVIEVGRLAGDAYAIVARSQAEAGSGGQADAVVDLVRTAVRPPSTIDGRIHYVDLSMGVRAQVVVPEPESEHDGAGAAADADAGDGTGATGASLLRDAEIALRAARAEGPGHVVRFAPDIHREVADRFALEHDLRRAIDAGDVVVFGQPQVDLVTGEVVGWEALARWHHEERGWVPPGEFVPLAERLGLMADLGRLLLGQVVDWLGTVGAEPWFAGRRVSANLSAAQLGEPDLVPWIAERCAAAGADPARLVLELTETAVMAHRHHVEVLDELRRTGFALSIDDFGTGYSSLAYLSRLPVAELKIDRTFVDGLGLLGDGAGPATADGGHRDDTTIVETVVAMARALGLRVVAEGVETRAQATALVALGCREAQGFWYSPAVPLADLPELVRTGFAGQAVPSADV